MLVQQHLYTVSISLCSGCSVCYVCFPLSGHRWTVSKCCRSGRCGGLDEGCVRCFTGCSSGRLCVMCVAVWGSDALVSFVIVTVIVNEMVLLIECFNE
jgi:hypothetical protein